MTRSKRWPPVGTVFESTNPKSGVTYRYRVSEVTIPVLEQQKLTGDTEWWPVTEVEKRWAILTKFWRSTQD